MTDRLSIGVERSAMPALPRDIFALVSILLIGAIGFVLFPDDLAFLTRLIGLALLVLSLDLVIGYCGIATLGHAAIFGVSAYAVGNACIAGLTDPTALLIVGAVSGATAGLLSGALVARFVGLPQLVLSIAIGQLTAALANKLSALTGGSDGLSGIEPGRVLGIFAFDMYGHTGYFFSVAVLAIVFVVLRRLVSSPFGLLCRAIKDDSLRARMIGARIYPRLVIMYGFSGAVAGIGGAIMAINTGVVGLDSVSFERSAEALIMLVVGGAGSLWGALFGSVVFQLFEHYVSAANPFHWLTMMGALLIAIVLFAPRGLAPLVGLLVQRTARLAWRKS
jgi:branched-chain amino acid transport system permease protein